MLGATAQNPELVTRPGWITIGAAEYHLQESME